MEMFLVYKTMVFLKDNRVSSNGDGLYEVADFKTLTYIFYAWEEQKYRFSK